MERLTHSCFIVSIYILVQIVDFGIIESPLRHLYDSSLSSLTHKIGIMIVLTSQVSWEEQANEISDGKLSVECLARNEPLVIVKYYHSHLSDVVSP